MRDGAGDSFRKIARWRRGFYVWTADLLGLQGTRQAQQAGQSDDALYQLHTISQNYSGPLTRRTKPL